MSEPMTDERRKEAWATVSNSIEVVIQWIQHHWSKITVDDGWASKGQIMESLRDAEDEMPTLWECLEEIERLKDEQCDACASNHHEMENLKEENSKLRELLEEIYLFAPLSKIRAFLDGEEL